MNSSDGRVPFCSTPGAAALTVPSATSSSPMMARYASRACRDSRMRLPRVPVRTPPRECPRPASGSTGPGRQAVEHRSQFSQPERQVAIAPTGCSENLGGAGISPATGRNSRHRRSSPRTCLRKTSPKARNARTIRVSPAPECGGAGNPTPALSPWRGLRAVQVYNNVRRCAGGSPASW